jgi:hypothetical protein
MYRTALLNQLARCNEHIDQTDRNIFAQRKRVDTGTAAGANVSIPKDLLKRFQEIHQALLKRQDALIVQIGNSVQH